MISKGISNNMESNQTQFLNAVYDSKYDTAKQLFENFDKETQRKYIDFRDYKQDSLLSIAVRDNPKPTPALKDYLSYFAKEGVAVEDNSFSVQPISYVAKYHGFEDVVQDILSKIKNNGVVFGKSVHEAFFDAVAANNTEMAKVFIKNGIYLEARNDVTALDMAVANNNEELVHLLLEKDDKLLNKNDAYESVLESAIRLQNPVIVKDLLDHGAYIQGHSGKHHNEHIDAFRVASQGKTDEQLKTDVIYNLVKDEYLARFKKTYGSELVPPSEDILLHRKVAHPQVKQADNQDQQEGQDIKFQFHKYFIGRKTVNEQNQPTIIPEVL